MTDENRYEERWTAHIEQLERLGWYLNAEHQQEMKELMADLEDVVEVAAMNKRREAEQGVSNIDYVTLGDV